MIPKGNRRGGGQQLATHLLNAHDNELVQVHELRGAIANDLHGAFSEWAAASTATKCKKYLYSLSINPDHRQMNFDKAHYIDFIERTERALGLIDQPRAIVFHSKDGREHCHVVWSRIDTDKCRAIEQSFDRPKLHDVAREFAHEYGIQLPAGMRDKTKAKDYEARKRQSNHAEKQQQERSGITKEERRRDVTAAWNASTTAEEFIRALEQAGYLLAQGDKRGYVVVDRAGEIHSLSRHIDGATGKQVTARLATFPPEKLPHCSKAQEFIRERQRIPLREHFKQAATLKRAELETAHSARRAVLDRKKSELEKQHRAERAALLSLQRDRNRALARERRSAEPDGLAAFLGRITGIERIRKKRQKEADAQRIKAQRLSIKELAGRHAGELKDIARQYRALARVEKREIRSMETAVRREIVAPTRPIPAKDREREQQRKAQLFRENAADITDEKERKRGKIITDKFGNAVKPPRDDNDRTNDNDESKDRTKDRDRPKGPDFGPR